jgi:hypothetical protein
MLILKLRFMNTDNVITMIAIMQIKIKQRKGSNECNLPPKYVAIPFELMHHVSA